MFNKSVEKTISQFLLIGLPFVTLFIVWGSVTDPVNITKLFAAGCVGFGVFAIALVFGARELWTSSKSLIITSALFILAMINAVVQSDASLTQNLYGVFGRQTGLITYVILVLVATAAALLRQKRSFDMVIWALLFSGIVNVLYCGWALIFGDFIGWNNPYGNILGLFGNPDFISAFLGMFIAGTLGYAFSKHLSWIYRVVFFALSVIALIEIKKSHAIQGLVVTAAGIAIVGFYLVRGKSKGALFTSLYVAVVGVVGGFALAGALQKGPLTSLIYKKSVSLRGSYWETGINIGKDHPWSGVGMDTYGNWYRALRPDRALKDTPGIGTVTNVAHNVVIDFFANGGYPLLITYIAFLVIGLIAIIKVTLRNREYDGTFVALAATWITYQLQSIISINQVGLAIWGWVLTGALVAYENSNRDKEEAVAKVKTSKEKEHIFSPQLVGGIGIVIGAIVAVPPLSGDSKWRAAVKGQNAQQVELALTPSYLTPEDAFRYAEAVRLFEQSKLYDLAYKYALKGVANNPDNFDSWKMLYAISKSTQADKDRALANMKRLDPRNPNVLAQ
jgi:O-antigen ligase